MHEAVAARGGHTALRVGNSVYVYGGANREQQYSEEVFRLCVESMSWERVQVPNSQGAVLHVQIVVGVCGSG